MSIVTSILATLVTAEHLFIFYLETIAGAGGRARRRCSE